MARRQAYEQHQLPQRRAKHLRLRRRRRRRVVVRRLGAAAALNRLRCPVQVIELEELAQQLPPHIAQPLRSRGGGERRRRRRRTRGRRRRRLCKPLSAQLVHLDGAPFRLTAHLFELRRQPAHLRRMLAPRLLKLDRTLPPPQALDHHLLQPSPLGLDLLQPQRALRHCLEDTARAETRLRRAARPAGRAGRERHRALPQFLPLGIPRNPGSGSL